MGLTVAAALLLKDLLIFFYGLRLEIFDGELMSVHERFIVFRGCRYSYCRIIETHLQPRFSDYVFIHFGRHGHPFWVRRPRVPVLIVILAGVHYDLGTYYHHY